MLDEESLTNKAVTSPTEDMLSTSQIDMNMQLFPENKQKSWTEPSFQSFCLLFHISYGVFAFLIHLQSHLNKTNKQKKKIYILFYIIHHFHKDKIKTFKTTTCPFIAHHWFTKIFWALLRFDKQQHFIIKTFFSLIQTLNTTDEKHEIQMENRKCLFLFLLCN